MGMILSESEKILKAYFTDDSRQFVNAVIYNEETDTSRVEQLSIKNKRFEKFKEVYSLGKIHHDTEKHIKEMKDMRKRIAMNIAKEEGYELKSNKPFLELLNVIFKEDIDSEELFKIKVDALTFLKDAPKKIRQKVRTSKSPLDILNTILLHKSHSK